jgi:hypothetical protein
MEIAFIMGGEQRGTLSRSARALSSMERYDVTSGQWSAIAAMALRAVALAPAWSLGIHMSLVELKMTRTKFQVWEDTRRQVTHGAM